MHVDGSDPLPSTENNKVRVNVVWSTGIANCRTVQGKGMSVN